MRPVLILVVATLLAVGCTGTRNQVFLSDIPEGTIFRDLDESTGFIVDPVLRITRHPDSPGDGVAAVKIHFTSAGGQVRHNINAVVWLPEGTLHYTPLGFIGTPSDRWKVDVEPGKGFTLLSSIPFQNLETYPELIEAFRSPTRVKLIWKEGVVFFQFPGEMWEVEVDLAP